MGRPKKFKGETKIISFRIPKEREVEIKKAVENLIDFGVAITHTTKDSIKSIHPFSDKGNKIREAPLGIGHPIADKVEMEHWEKEARERIKVLKAEITNPPKGLMIGASAYIRIREKEIKEIESKLNNH